MLTPLTVSQPCSEDLGEGVKRWHKLAAAKVQELEETQAQPQRADRACSTVRMPIAEHSQAEDGPWSTLETSQPVQEVYQTLAHTSALEVSETPVEAPVSPSRGSGSRPPVANAIHLD